MRRGDAGALCDFGSPAPGAAQLCAILLPDKGLPAGPDRLAPGADAGSIGRCSRAAKNWAGGACLERPLRASTTTDGALAVPIPA